MKSLLRICDRIVHYILAVFLFIMGTMLFLNVILRYFWGQGIPWAEELTRFLFVWITFLGAVIASADNKHLGFSTLIKRMPLGIKKIFYLIGNAMILYILYLLLIGSWKMTLLGHQTMGVALPVPFSFMFGVGLIAFGAMIMIVLVKSYQAIFVEGAIDVLVDLKESEEEIALEERMEGGGK